MKRFIEWFKRKTALDQKEGNPPFVSERDIWWAAVGENIGSEINGSGEKFTRPVVIFKKLNKGFFTILPLTLQPHSGPWYIEIIFKDKIQFVCLQHLSSLDFRRLDRKIGQVSREQFAKIQEGFSNLYVQR